MLRPASAKGVLFSINFIMKKKFLSSILGLSAFMGMFFINVPESKAETCRFVRETENPLFAVYNCGGTEITVMRPTTIQ